MPRDVAVITTWGHPARGREAKSLEVFMDALTFWGKKAADGKCSEPDAFYADDASNGMLIVKGKSDALQEIQESDEYQKLIEKAQLIVDDLKVHSYVTGDEEIQRGMRIYAEAGNELGYM
jgi:hypothetical protein